MCFNFITSERERAVQFHSSAGGYLIFPASFIERTFHSPIHALCTFVANQLTKVPEVISGHSVLLPCVFVCMLIPCCFDYNGFIVYSEVK
jgi:hypothetical protein